MVGITKCCQLSLPDTGSQCSEIENSITSSSAKKKFGSAWPTTAVVGQALPNFFFALLLVMLFSISLHWLPVSGSDSWQHFVMPTIALGYYVAPAFMRLVRAGMIEVLEADYIRTAR